MNRENTKSINPSVLKTISETLDIDQATAEQVLHLFSESIYVQNYEDWVSSLLFYVLNYKKLVKTNPNIKIQAPLES